MAGSSFDLDDTNSPICFQHISILSLFLFILLDLLFAEIEFPIFSQHLAFWLGVWLQAKQGKY